MNNELLKKIKELRNKTGISIQDCKKALLENNMDIEKSIITLQKKGIINAESRSLKLTNNGTIIINVSDDKKKAVILEINCETDFVSKSDDFQNFAKFLSSKIIESDIISDEEHNIDVTSISNDINDEKKKLIAKLNENILIKRIKKITTKNFIFSYIYEINKIGKIGAIIIVDKLISDKDIYKNILLQIIAMNPKYISKEKLSKEIINEKLYSEENILLEQKYIKDNKTVIKDLIKNNFIILEMIRFEIGE